MVGVLGVVAMLLAVALPNFRVQAQLAGDGFLAPHVVTASIEARPEKIAVPGHGVVIIHLVVASGYHIQSHHPLESFLIPAAAKLLPSSGVGFRHGALPGGDNHPRTHAGYQVGKTVRL